MIRPLVVRLVLAVWLVLLRSFSIAFDPARPGRAAPPQPRHETVPGQFFPITEPITNETIAQIRAAATPVHRPQRRARAGRPILVFEFRPGETARRARSEFGAAYDLANLISTELDGAKRTVAYVPEPLQGYAVLAALACDEIVMGPEASLGPITPGGPGGRPPPTASRSASSPMRKGRDPDLLLGMLDRDADLRARPDGRQAAPLRAGRATSPSSRQTHQVDRGRARLGGGPARRPDAPSGRARRGSPS